MLSTLHANLYHFVFFLQPHPTTQAGGAQPQANPLRSNQNLSIHVDPQGGVAITSIISSMTRPGAPTQNAQATQGVQTTTTTSGTRHGGDNSNGSRETFSSSFGNQRSSVSSNGTGSTGTGETPQPGGRMTRIIVDDFIALVSNIAPGLSSPAPPSTSVSSSATQGQAQPQSAGQSQGQGQPQGSGAGQSGSGGMRFQIMNPAPSNIPPNHPDPSLPCQSFHFGPQTSQSSQTSGQQETRQPSASSSQQARASETPPAASAPSSAQQPSEGTSSGQRGEPIFGTICSDVYRDCILKYL